VRLLLAPPRAHQALEKNKGHTLLVFDNKGHDEQPLIKMILSPPEWSDSYYSRVKKQEALDHIIDALYFADSMHVPMLQVADFLAYFFRRHVEIAEKLLRSMLKKRSESANGSPSWPTDASAINTPRAVVPSPKLFMHTVQNPCVGLEGNNALLGDAFSSLRCACGAAKRGR